MKSYLLALSLAAFPAAILPSRQIHARDWRALLWVSAEVISRNFNSSSWSNSKNSFNNNRSDRTN